MLCAEIESFLLVARRTDIRRVSFDSEEGIDITLPLAGLHGAVGVDWDEQEDYVFWSDITTDTISRAHLNGSGQQVNYSVVLALQYFMLQ